MPELPEVEVTKRGISTVLNNAVIKSFLIYQNRLRENISSEFKTLRDLQVLKLERRAKYILITTNQGVIILHLVIFFINQNLHTFRKNQNHIVN